MAPVEETLTELSLNFVSIVSKLNDGCWTEAWSPNCLGQCCGDRFEGLLCFSNADTELTVLVKS